jgi:hemolysin-activating ACP:hemolysin acyltransferase
MALIVKKVRDRWLALGLAAHFVAKRETFGRFPASDLIRTLTGQIERGHYLFAFDTSTDPARVCAYFGWSLYDHAAAERFAKTGVPPPDLTSGGEVVWILTSVAENRSAFFALVKALRALYPTHRAMGIRHKADGRRVMFDQWRTRNKDKQSAAIAD